MADLTSERSDLPTGTVTFLRTDVEGSMGLARTLGTAWDEVNAAHLAVLREVVALHDGVCVRTEGDAMFAVFPEAGAAVRAAVDGQRTLSARTWPANVDLRVRMGLHSGEAHRAGDDYGGFEVSRAARIAAVGHGGQVIVSGTTQSLVETSLPAGLLLRDLGRHAIRDLPVPEHLFQLDVDGLRHEFPPIRVTVSTAGNLPPRLTTLIGRDADLDQLATLMAAHRLVTLTGPGGIGKTSLAIELARSASTEMPEGAWLVALDGVTDPTLILSVIARTLGLFDGIERPAADALPSFLAERSLILVLDNFEHLLEAAGDVATLLRMSERSRILVTSRAPLRLGGEQEYPVRPLPIRPASETTDVAAADPATALFVDRGHAVLPDWQPEPDLPVVREICALLDGLPLGIELAAARMSVLPAAAIRDRLAANLPLPGAGPRDAPARQRTLDGAIAWSHDLLSPDDQRALHGIAVFEGGFDIDQATDVIDGNPPGDVLERMVALAEQSLITRDRVISSDAGRIAGSGIRFAMLRTVQGYALRRVTGDGREQILRHRHALAYLGLAELAAGRLFTSAQPTWIDRLVLDEPNIQAALRWSIAAGQTELALRFIAALWRFWQVTGRLEEGSAWAVEALSMPGANAPTPARLAAVGAAGSIAYWRSERERCLADYHEELALAERLADRAAVADAHFNLASATYVGGEHGKSARHLSEARRLFVELGDVRGVNRADWGLTNLILDTDGPAAMLTAVRPVLDRAVALDDAPYVVLAGGSLAWGHFMLGELPSAARWGLRSLLASYGMRDVAGTSIALPMAAVVAIEFGLLDEAALTMGAFEGLCQRYGVTPPIGLETLIRRTDPGVRLRTLLEPAALEVSLERGRRFTIDEAVEVVVRILDAIPDETSEG